MKIIIGIYIIKNITNNKIYVGSAVNIDKRLKEHRYSLRKNQHCNMHLQRAWNMDGETNFIFNIYQICNKEDLIYFEQIAIDNFDKDILYNISPNAGSTLGKNHSEETKIKIGIKSKGRNIGRKHTQEELINMSKAQKGKIISEETKIKMSQNRKGIKLSPFTEEHKNKISLALKGRKIPKEIIEKVRLSNMGKICSQETKLKISKALKGRISNRKGVRLSEETRIKMSKAHIGLNVRKCPSEFRSQRSCRNWKETDEVPGWKNIKEIMKGE